MRTTFLHVSMRWCCTVSDVCECMFADVLMRCCQSNTVGTVPTPILQILDKRSSNSVEPSVQMSQCHVLFIIFYQGRCAFSLFSENFHFHSPSEMVRSYISKLSSTLKVFQSQILIFLPNKTMQRSSPQGSKHSLHLFLQTLHKSMCTQHTILISLIFCLSLSPSFSRCKSK